MQGVVTGTSGREYSYRWPRPTLPRHTPILEAGREDVDGPAHATGNQSSPQKHRSDQEIQEIPPLATIPSSGRVEEHRDGIAGNYQPVYTGTMGITRAH